MRRLTIDFEAEAAYLSLTDSEILTMLTCVNPLVTTFTARATA